MGIHPKGAGLRHAITGTLAAACAFWAAQPVGAQVNRNTTYQEGRVNSNESSQRGTYNDNETYQQGWYSEDRSEQNGRRVYRRRGDRWNRAAPHEVRRWRDQERPREWEARKRYRYGNYRPPFGWEYHRWRYGERLPHDLWDRDYWILDFVLFGLTPPTPGYVWVRYGNDALLISTHDGEIVEIAYDIFY